MHTSESQKFFKFCGIFILLLVFFFVGIFHSIWCHMGVRRKQAGRTIKIVSDLLRTKGEHYAVSIYWRFFVLFARYILCGWNKWLFAYCQTFCFTYPIPDRSNTSLTTTKSQLIFCFSFVFVQLKPNKHFSPALFLFLSDSHIFIFNFALQLKNFWQQLLADKTIFSACGICRIDRRLLTKVRTHTHAHMLLYANRYMLRNKLYQYLIAFGCVTYVFDLFIFDAIFRYLLWEKIWNFSYTLNLCFSFPFPTIHLFTLFPSWVGR